VEYPFGDRCHSSEPGVSASLSQAESWCVHNRSAVPALVCRHKVCRKCAAEVRHHYPVQLIKRCDMWSSCHSKLAVSKGKSAEIPTTAAGRVQCNTWIFFWKLEDTRQPPWLSELSNGLECKLHICRNVTGHLQFFHNHSPRSTSLLCPH